MTGGFGVWGGRGYLGQHFCARLSQRAPGRPLGREELPRGLDLLVDASYPSGGGGRTATAHYLEAVERRSRWAASQGARYVYVASTSSLPPVTSRYGQVKAQAEHATLSAGGLLLRAGLVVADERPGGRFGHLLDIVRRPPVLPLPAREEFRIYVTPLGELLAALDAYLSATPPPPDHWVSGTRLSSLSELLETRLRPEQRVVRLGRRTSAAAAAVARRLHAGQLDSLASIASPPPAPPSQETGPC